MISAIDFGAAPFEPAAGRADGSPLGASLLDGYPPLLTVNQGAELFQVSVRTMRAWCARGAVPSVKVSGRVYLPKSRLVEMLEAFADGE